MNKEQQIKEIMLTIPQKIVAYNGDSKGQHLYGEQRLQIAEALYNAGYRKVPKYAVILSPEERDEEMKAYNEERKERENELLTIQMACFSAQVENEGLKAENKQLQEQLNSANAGNVNCSGCEAVETNAVKEFAEKLKEKTGTIFDYYKHFQKVVLSEQIDELLKEYEK